MSSGAALAFPFLASTGLRDVRRRQVDNIRSTRPKSFCFMRSILVLNISECQGAILLLTVTFATL
jgi:hypothetical protein